MTLSVIHQVVVTRAAAESYTLAVWPPQSYIIGTWPVEAALVFVV